MCLKGNWHIIFEESLVVELWVCWKKISAKLFRGKENSKRWIEYFEELINAEN